MLARLVPYAIILLLAGAMGVGGYWAGKRVGAAECFAEQFKVALKQAGEDADRLAEWEEADRKIALEDSQAEDRNAIVDQKVEAAIRLERRGVSCGGAKWLHELGGIE